VLLNPPVSELRSRVVSRAAQGGHFMPTSLLDSQLATLEGGDDDSEWLVAVREAGLTPQEVAGKVLSHLKLTGGTDGPQAERVAQVTTAAAGRHST
jgi:gluconate kinase